MTMQKSFISQYTSPIFHEDCWFLDVSSFKSCQPSTSNRCPQITFYQMIFTIFTMATLTNPLEHSTALIWQSSFDSNRSDTDTICCKHPWMTLWRYRKWIPSIWANGRRCSVSKWRENAYAGNRASRSVMVSGISSRIFPEKLIENRKKSEKIMQKKQLLIQ